jgi:hypothetical protein
LYAQQVIISTTHLKAAKSGEGELYRLIEAEQLLKAIDKVRRNILLTEGVSAAVVLTGDMNAKPDDGCKEDYPALTYRSIKAHPLGLISVYNDHVLASDRGDASGTSGTNLEYDTATFRFYEVPFTKDRSRVIGLATEGIYTTWKARLKKGKEKLSKHCIDYIFYSSSSSDTSTSSSSGSPCLLETSLTAVALLDVLNADEVGAALLPSKTYPSDHLAIAADLLLKWRKPDSSSSSN